MIPVPQTSSSDFRVEEHAIYFGNYYIPFNKVAHIKVCIEKGVVRVYFTSALFRGEQTTVDFILPTAAKVDTFVRGLIENAYLHIDVGHPLYPIFPHYSFFLIRAYKHQYQFFSTFYTERLIDLSTLWMDPLVWGRAIGSLQELGEWIPETKEIFKSLCGLFSVIGKHKTWSGYSTEFFSNLYCRTILNLNPWHIATLKLIEWKANAPAYQSSLNRRQALLQQNKISFCFINRNAPAFMGKLQ